MDKISLYTLRKEIDSLKNKANNYLEKAEIFDRTNTVINYEGYIQALDELEDRIKSMRRGE